jgi:GDP-4-dehydro-6-deoxy-D-mannose reductase
MLTAHRSPLTTSLITGVNGFVGQYLSANLAAHDREVIGIDIQDKCELDGIRYFQADIRRIDTIIDIFNKIRPREIYHLAAVSFPREFDRNSFSSFQTNLMGTISLFEAMRNLDLSATMLTIGSGKQYQPIGSSKKILETDVLVPDTYYGISKNAVEMIARFYINHFHIDIRMTRSFNHTGPSQSPLYVCSDWARQIARIALHQAPPEIFIGNIDAVIDFSDVRDIVEAYRLIVERGKRGEVYNVCSGRGISLKYILDYLVSKSSADIAISIQKEKIIPHSSCNELVGDNGKIVRETGWIAKISLEQTLDDLYAWWLEQLRDPTRMAG